MHECDKRKKEGGNYHLVDTYTNNRKKKPIRFKLRCLDTGNIFLTDDLSREEAVTILNKIKETCYRELATMNEELIQYIKEIEGDGPGWKKS